MDSKRKKYLLKNIFIFAISNFSTKLIIFLLVPLYTNTMTPEEYGTVDLLFTICGFLYPLFTLNVAEGIYRFSMDKDNDEYKIFSIGIICFLVSIILGMITIPILHSIPNYSKYSLIFYIYLVTFSLSQILLINLKGQEKLKLFTIGNIINTSCIAIFNILFLVIFKWGIFGYFMGNILSNMITIIYGLKYNEVIKKIHNFDFDKNLFKNITKYSIVLIPTSFMWWIINSSDRIMVTSLVGAYANGIYAISYKIPSMMIVIAQIFNQAWIFSAIKEYENKSNDEFTNKVFNIFFLVLCVIGMFLVLIIKFLFKIYVSAEYYNAWKYVPFLVLGFVFATSATFLSTSYNVHKDSKGFLLSGLVGAMVNIILNCIFIPSMKVYGAAFATLISYISVFIYRIIDTKKYLKIKMGKEKKLLILGLLISCALTYLDNIYGIFLQSIILIIIIIMYKNNFINLIKNFLKSK